MDQGIYSREGEGDPKERIPKGIYKTGIIDRHMADLTEEEKRHLASMDRFLFSGSLSKWTEGVNRIISRLRERYPGEID